MSSVLRPRLATALAVAALLAVVVGLYTPLEVLTGQRQLFGMDFFQLHQYRLEFLEETQASGSALPAWYGRELLGTPFRADPQNYPWVPWRLLLMALRVPSHAFYAPAVALSASLAALFTFLLARALGYRLLGSLAAGFTFAAAGFFASRVMAGHMTLLEGYPALPLLLWLAERYAGDPSGARRTRLVALALGTAAVVVNGHPQCPAYAVAGALALLAVRAPRGRSLRGAAAILLGIGATLAVWWPTLLLIGRSARTLPLGRSASDVAFPYARLLALFFPWRDGWPPTVLREPQTSFGGYASDAVFWDTTSYLGILPWLAALLILANVAWRRERPTRAAITLGAGALLCALLSLPLAQPLMRALPGTFLRSPARLWYVPTLVLALALGLFLDRLSRTGRLGAAAAAVLLGIHAADLAVNARPFVRSTIAVREPVPAIETALAAGGESRLVAIDYNLPIRPNRRHDDVGFFGSLQLAASYRSLWSMAGAPRGHNVQELAGAWHLPARALAGLGIRHVVTTTDRPDLVPLLEEKTVRLYRVPGPAPARALLFPPDAVRYHAERDMTELLGSADHRLDRVAMLPLAEIGRLPLPGSGGLDGPVPAVFRRTSPDVIEVDVESASGGLLRLTESHDPGWTAAVDGAAVPVLRADGFLLAVRVSPGRHRLRLTYRTPGAATGAALSLAALAALALLVHTTRTPSGTAP